MQSRQDAITDGVRFVTREVIRDPVKEAVREALREEAAVVQADEAIPETSKEPPESGQSDESSGSRLGLVLLSLVAVGGIAYIVRSRRSESDEWSEFDERRGEEAGYEAGSEYGSTESATAGE